VSRDEEIESVYVGGAKPSSYPIKLVDYDPEWPQQYAKEADRVRAALGDKVIQLEHVGSTSVPGLPAKPILDMLLVVADSADEPSYVPAMQAAGFVLTIREPKWFQHRVFKGPAADLNLHVFSRGCEEIPRMLAFRDHLRRNAADRELYANAKRDLAKKTWKYVQHYADAKTEVVREILKRALA